MCVCVFACTCVCTSVCMYYRDKGEGVKSPGARVICGCKLLNVRPGDQTQVLCKNILAQFSGVCVCVHVCVFKRHS